MLASHDHAGHATTAQQRDPTGTTTLRRQYGAQLYKRFRRLKGVMWQVIAVDDRLGLGEDTTSTAIPEDIRRGFQQDEPFPEPDDVPPQSELPLPPDPGASPGVAPDPTNVGPDIRDYIEWYQRTQNRLVHGPEGPGGTQWSEKYVRYAYEKGGEDADTRMSASGIDMDEPGVALSFDMPIHVRTLQAVIDMNRAGLEGVTDATRREVARELVAAVIEGRNPRDAARAINDRIDAIGITRARAHARSVIVGAYNESTLARYEQIMGGDAELAILAEFRTAGDGRVCEICAGMEGRTFSVREAKGVIPVHPNCRCTWIPVAPEDQPTPTIGGQRAVMVAG